MKFKFSRSKRNELLNVYSDAWKQQLKLAESTHEHGVVSRRDFMAHGLIAGTASILVPVAATSLSAPAWAQSASACAAVGDLSRIPALCFDCAGGTLSLGQDFVVTTADGSYLSGTAVNVMGLATEDASTAANTDSTFGIPMHAKSGLLAGMLAGTSPEARANCDGLVMLCASADDSQNNRHSINYYIASSGTVGSVVPLSGNRSTTSGGNSAAIDESIRPSFRPVTVSTPSQAAGLTARGHVYRLLNNNNVSNIPNAATRDEVAKGLADQVAQAIVDFSHDKLGRYPATDLPSKVKELAACGYVNARGLSQTIDPARVDPNLDPIIGGVTGIFSATRGANATVNGGLLNNTMTATKLILDKYSGAATVTIDGRDYHTIATRQGQYNAKFEEGLMIGLAIEAAHQKGQNLFIYLISDGAATTNAGAAPEAYNPRDPATGLEIAGTNSQGTRPSGDDENGGALVMLVYRAGVRRDVNSPLRSTTSRQIGNVDQSTGKIDRNANLLANNVVAAAKFVFLNYLALHGEEGRFKDLVGQNPLGDNLEPHLKFKNIRSA
jgi:hypothetical protein